MPSATESARAPREPRSGNRLLENAGLAVLLALAGWFYFWTATSAGSPYTWEPTPYDLYNRLTDGFLAGRTSFLEEPPPELAKLANPYDPAQNAPYRRYHDVSYYRGRYYLYFGPTPVLLLLAPWKLLTGYHLPQNLAVAAFAWGAALLAVWLLRGLRDRHFPATPAWMLWAVSLAAAGGNMLPVLLRRPLYYELAIASACCCGLAALGCFFQAQSRAGRGRLLWLSGAGLGLGLAIAARPDYLFGGAAFVGAWSWWQWRAARPRERAAWLAFGRAMAPLVLPLVACGLGLLAYNQARFGSWLEFGMRYQLAGSSQVDQKFMSLWFLGPNLYYYFAALPRLSAYFPFVQVTGMPPFALPAGYSGQENMYGLLPTLPWLLAAAALVRGPAGALREFTMLAGSLGAGILGFLLLIAGANNRYLVDFVPVLTVLAGAGVLCWESSAAGVWRLAGRVGWLATLGWTVAFNVLVSIQHNDLMRYHNPQGYAKLARAANGFAEAATRASRRASPLRIEFTLPAGRTGQLEPMVVSGWSFRADFVYFYYTDDRHIQIGFEHTSYGGPMSKPLTVDFAAAHVIEVDLGSLYPPREHPYFDGWSTEAITRRKRTLLVKLDGQVVHEGLSDFYDASPGDVSVGRNHVSDAFGRKFTGVIRSVTRPGTRFIK